MESEQAKEDCAPTQPAPAPPSQTRKQRIQSSKEKAQAQAEVKPKPRPRYSDKARKNAKNKKDKAGAADKGAPAGGQAKNEDPDVKEEHLQNADVQANGLPDSTNEEANATLWREAPASEEEAEEEEEEGESWDTLFNDDGDCLEPHLLEEVSLAGWTKSHTQTSVCFTPI